MITQLQEYQNRLYLNDQLHEIMIFDLSGNYIQKIPVEHIDRFDFYHDELFWIENNHLTFYNVYDMHRRQLELPPGAQPLFVQVIEDKLIVFHKKEMIIYRLVRP